MRFIPYFLIIFLVSCSSSDNRILVKNSGEAQGSYYHIQYLSVNGKNYKSQIDSILFEIDSSLSIYKEYSLISRLNKGIQYRTDDHFNNVYISAKKVYYETNGNFDCTVLPLVRYYGFYSDSQDSLMIDSIKIKYLLDLVGFDKINLIEDSLVLPKGVQIDFNSIAQGYTIDIISNFLESKGDSNYLVELGGELLSKGYNADGNIWRVGVDKPLEEIDYANRFQFILDLENKALATSGNYRKFFEYKGVKFSHTINPFNGFPSNNRLLSVSVIHDDCILADAYATAFMVMGLKETKLFVQQRLDIEVYLVYTDKNDNWKTYISPKMQDRIIN